MDQIMQQADETADRPSWLMCHHFIERQLPVSLLSKESYRERMAGPSQTLTPLGSYWKGTEAACSSACCFARFASARHG